jgi:hypothetical protein
MKTCIQTFRAGTEELLAFLTNTEHEAKLLKLLLRPLRHDALEEEERQLLSQMAAAQTDRKRYIYCVAIVSLYGLLERLIDSLIEAFVGRVAGLVDSYEKMPDAIKKNHVPLSLELVKALIEERHRQGTTQENVIANLHSCLSGATDFQVNGAAFVLHRGNISLQKITSFLTTVGIEPHLRRVTQARDLVEFFETREPERDIRTVADQELAALLEPINELVERRNEVSHGVISVDAIESVELLKERCRFVAAYGAALYDVFAQELLKHGIVLPIAQPLGKPIAVYNRSIVCFEATHCMIAVGNILVAATSSPMEPFRYGPISSLQVDHVGSVPNLLKLSKDSPIFRQRFVWD